MTEVATFYRFVVFSVKEVTSGGRGYWLWVGGLFVLVVIGFFAYLRQLDQGLISTAMFLAAMFTAQPTVKVVGWPMELPA